MLTSVRTARIVLMFVVVLAFVMIADVGWAATHHRVQTHIDNCAMVLSREHGPVCR